MRKIFLKAVIATVFIFVFFLTTPFVSAFFAVYRFDISSVNETLDSLESKIVPFFVSIDPSYVDKFEYAEGGALYRINRSHFCEEYDEWGEECVDNINLCPYISIQPNNEEQSEVGFNLNASIRQKATGEINGVGDSNDSWNIMITSPCFEGQCPSDYDYLINGAPLSSSMKGKTFTCDLSLEDDGSIFQVKKLIDFKKVYAQTPSNVLRVSVVLTGESQAPVFGGISNVLFLPGLEASRLYKGTILNCQVNCEDQLWEPNNNNDVEDLYLNIDGTSKNNLIYTRDVIKETNTPVEMGMFGQNIYKSFSKMMDDFVVASSTEKMARWEAYAYDWRQGVDDIIENGTKYKDNRKSLITTLENLVASSTTGKVTIIAHSNGGLLAKTLLVKLQEDKMLGLNNLIDKIDNLILVAVPQIGTASAIPAMLHGYDQKKAFGLLVSEVRARELGRNMISAYGLLPSKEYVNRISASPVTFVDNQTPSGVTTDFVTHYGNTVDSYSEYKNFLLGVEGRSQPAVNNKLLPIKLSSELFLKAENLHNKIDFWTPPEGMRVIEVAGWGLDTLASFEYYPKFSCSMPSLTGSSCGYYLDERPRFTVDGDKTVVVPSAQYVSGNVEKYWVDIERQNGQIFGGFRRNREHKDILEINSLNNMIKSVLQKTDIVFDTVLKNTEPVDSENRFRLSVHSPVTIGVYDSEGNFTGKICPTGYDFCYVKDEIPNSSYLEFGDGKYLNVLEENLHKVVLSGTDIGTFTYEAERVSPDGLSSATKFVDIPVTPITTAEITINATSSLLELKLDVTGDGVTDMTIEPSDSFDAVVYLKVMRKTVESLNINKVRKNLILKRIDDTIKLIEKGKINKAKLKIEHFQRTLNVNSKLIEIFEKFKWNHKKDDKQKTLSKQEIEMLMSMLETLLSNLNK